MPQHLFVKDQPMFTSTTGRVEQNTSTDINEAIRRQTDQNVAFYASAGRAAIQQRLTELDEEWDIERCLETMAPTLTLIGLTLGLSYDRRWLALPLVIQSFFLQHAVQGWCPPIPILRRLGVRTSDEIAAERYALKAIRGDFRDVANDPFLAIDAART
jgi:hypothetical protein